MRNRNATPILDAVRRQRGELPGRDPYNAKPAAPADPWTGAPTTDQRNTAEMILAGCVPLTLED